MSKAEMTRVILVETENKVGALAEVASTLADNKVNIIGIAAYGLGDKAKFMLITEDNDKAFVAFRSRGHVASEKDVVLVELANKAGTLIEVADKIKTAGIDVEYIYGTTCNSTCDCRLVISSDDNEKVINILNE